MAANFPSDKAMFKLIYLALNYKANNQYHLWQLACGKPNERKRDKVEFS